ncbi:MAG: hypothetical protein PHO10_02160 [Gemmiger sp.]|nr:hypothetical protein [Gemmiger sp.]
MEHQQQTTQGAPNLIFSAFATLAGYREGDGAALGAATYYRCLVVALCSAKQHNPGDVVALVTNQPVPPPYAAQLEAAGVAVWQCPFATFRVDAALEWSLAFYKLCALGWVLENHPHPRYLLLDVDTYTQYPYTDLWREAEEAVLLYQVPHAASQPMTAAIASNYAALYGGAPVLTHFGGELIGGSHRRLAAFMARCRAVYDAMCQQNLRPHEGDEFITCAAAYQSQQAGEPVRAANAYIFRYWLGARFYYVSTNYCNDPVCILHLPGNGKARQLKLLYRYYAQKGRFPKPQTVYALCCLPAAHPPLLRSLWVRLLAWR